MVHGRVMACGLVLALWPSLAAAKQALRVVPKVFDPTHTHAVGSDWLPFSGHHDENEALVLFKLVATSVNAAAGATAEGVQGRVLDELGFDVFDGGHCGAGAPRFDVITSDGSLYFFGCLYGVHGPAGDQEHQFDRVRFGDVDAVPASASEPPWPGFGHARIQSIDIVFDEGIDLGSGFTVLDNIDIDGQLIGSGGRSHHHDHDDDDRD